MRVGLLCCGAAVAACAASPTAGVLAAGHRDDPPMTQTQRRANEIAGAAAGVVTPITIGSSREGRPLIVLRIGEGGDEADRRPALLIVAGVDPMHEVGTRVALGVAERLAAEHRDLLGRATVYILPELNPDTREWLRAQAATRECSRTLSPDDADRDGRIDEDGPVDLNGDGAITMMRIANPRPDSGVEATHVIDASDPRLMRRPDASKGERATHALIVESTDADGDGFFAEDGPGGVDLDRNFPHLWPEFRDGAGVTPLSEPESRAVAEWILAPTGPGRDNIVAVLVYSPADNLLNTPPTGKMDPTGVVPLGIEERDKGVYESVGAAFKEITGMTGAPKGEDRWPGSLAAWAYGHVGAYAFTTPVWVRPDLVTRPQEAGGAAEEPAKVERGGRGRGPGDRGGGGASGGDEDARWLAYLDERVGEGGEPGFVEWAAFDHPVFGAVEIGGFLPGARLNPPESEIDRLVDEQTRFAAELLGRLPRLGVEEPVTRRLGEGVWRVTVRIVNDGRLPTRSAMGVKVWRLPPIRLSLDLPGESIIGGERVQRTSAIPAGGRSRRAGSSRPAVARR